MRVLVFRGIFYSWQPRLIKAYTTAGRLLGLKRQLALLSYYIFSQRHALNNLPENPVLVKSIVTGDLSRAIAKKYGIETVETLTGFKNICGKTNEYDVTKEKNYVFGYEESIGFCYGIFIRDKDAVGS